MTLGKSRRMLQEYTRLEASDRSVAKAGNDKLMIDQSIKAAQATAGTAGTDAYDALVAADLAAAQAASALAQANAAVADAQTAYDEAVASGDAAAAAAAAAALADAKADLGELAYNGTHSGPGVIESRFQDHGIGDNIFNYRDVYLGWRPYGWFTWSPLDEVAPAAYTDNFEVWYDTILENDVVMIYSTLDSYNTMGYRHITQGSKYQDNTPHIASMHVRSHTGRSCDIQLRVEEYANLSDLGDGSPILTTHTSPLFSLNANSRYRLSFPFTTGVGSYIVLRVRGRRTGGSAGSLPMASLYNPMLEEVVAGQSQPSKFTMPYFNRGELPSNALEGDVLKGFIWGLGLSKGAGTLGYNVEAGAAYVPGVEKVVPFAGSAQTLSTSTAGMRYIYLTSNADGTAGTIRADTAVPAAPYSGTARHFVGNQMERFIGVLVVYGSQIVHFQDQAGYYAFQDHIGNREVLNNGTLTAATNVPLASYMPNFARAADIQMRAVHLAGANPVANCGTPGVHLANEGTLRLITATDSRRPYARGMVKTDASRNVSYSVSASANIQCSLDMMGFWYDR